jgi:hypothetical protein
MALSLSKRMDIVEQRLTSLERLPERMTALESQFLQLRTEMRAEFSAIRIEMQAGDEETRRVLREEITGLGTHMRVLHEELISRISMIQEGRPTRPRSRR